jgi:hypothetical protein
MEMPFISPKTKYLTSKTCLWEKEAPTKEELKYYGDYRNDSRKDALYQQNNRAFRTSSVVN